MPFRKSKLINPTIMRGVYLSVHAKPLTLLWKILSYAIVMLVQYRRPKHDCPT